MPALADLRGWMNQRQQCALDDRREENQILRTQLGGTRLRLNDLLKTQSLIAEPERLALTRG